MQNLKLSSGSGKEKFRYYLLKARTRGPLFEQSCFVPNKFQCMVLEKAKKNKWINKWINK